METRQLGASGLMVPALSLGTATFGGGNATFKGFGESDADEALNVKPNQIVKFEEKPFLSTVVTQNIEH